MTRDRSQPLACVDLGLEVLPSLVWLWEPSPVHTALGVNVLSQQGAEGKEAWVTSQICLGVSASVRSLLLFGMAVWQQ